MTSNFTNELAAAISAHEALPKFESELTLADAYALQHDVTRQVSPDATGRIKAGVTASPVQEFFGLEHALIASLYPQNEHVSGCELPYIEGRNIECEVAVLLDGEGAPKAIAPAIEIVLVNFSDPSDMNAPNLVACNLGADAYILGDFIPWGDAFDNLSATLHRGDEVISQANMNDAIGGPRSAVAWMVTEAEKRGFARPEDTILMTGACGPVTPAEPGTYKMSIGGLGDVQFTIK